MNFYSEVKELTEIHKEILMLGVEEQAKCQFVLKTMDLCMCLTWLKYKLG
jgi:hypothetical protein